MYALVCLSGMDTEEFLGKALAQLNPSVRLTLLYVVDTRPAEEMGYLHRRHLFGPPGGGREHKMEEADQELARQVLDEAKAFCEKTGFSGKVLMLQIRRGRPEREIIDYANQTSADLIVIGARFRGANVAATPGPASIGPVARFVIDHAACNLMVVK